VTGAITGRSVFINCPFDDRYRSIFEAIIFTVHDCGYIARSALEFSDSSTTRIDKIVDLIGRCRFGIHDLSRTDLSEDYGLPRFNMPFELGIFLGAQKFGGKAQKRKRYLILDRERFRYQRFLSDIAGQDIQAHGDRPEQAVRAVRTWLSDQNRAAASPGSRTIWNRFREFQRDLGSYARAMKQDPDDLTFNDLTRLISLWLNDNREV
jgi:hypothetical protein